MIFARKWSFRPDPIATVASAAAFLLLLYLGAWQLQRAEEKQTNYESYREKASLDPVDLNGDPEPGSHEDYLLWRKALLTGSYADPNNYLLDNQINGGIPGYHVFAPFKLEGANRWVLVNRGWVAAGDYRNQLPDIETPQGTVTLKAQIYPLTQMLLLDDIIDEQLGQTLRRVQQINLESIRNQLGYNFVPYIVRLESSSPSAYATSWTDPGSGSARHSGYAFQWFMLAIVLAIIYFSLNISIRQNDDE